ncbi:MAG: CocE/NonD family hydrolase, partial [Actinobacteria bacterium]|nr:CocE/NonD family hydrolase [Actinomycetota bacterium]
ARPLGRAADRAGEAGLRRGVLQRPRHGGCIDWFGPDEQKDQAAIVEWLAERPWSSGRVAMGGRSYMAGTAFEAAIEQTPSLKTVVVGGLMTDLYTLVHSPQGAASTAGQQSSRSSSGGFSLVATVCAPSH